jgi:hypothetical protein
MVGQRQPRAQFEGARGGRLLQITTLCAVLGGAALRWPALFAGFFTDDYQQLAMLRGRFLLARPSWDLFWFGPRSQAELQRLLDFGFEPWWTAEAYRLSMFRPLASLLIALDDQLFGGNALACHLHSFAWWALLVVGVAALLGRLLPPVAAALGVALFALDESHNVPLAWLANRSTLVGAALGVLALLAHVHASARAQAPARTSWLALAALLWSLSLAAGEYAFGLLAYLLAYELLGASGPLRARLARLLPASALATGYLALRAQLGHGISGSGMYISPGEPLRYLLQGGSRVAALAADLLFAVPAAWLRTNTPWRNHLLELELFTPDAWHELPDWRTYHVAIGLLALIAGALVLRRVVRDAGDEYAALRWLAGASLLALLAAAAAAPSSRLLVAPAIGTSALLAAAIVHGLRAPRRNVAFASLCAAALAVHGALAARSAYADAARLRGQADAARRWALAAELPADPRALDVVIVSASDFTTATHVPWLRLAHGKPLPRSYRQLSGALVAHEIARVDDHSLELTMLSSDVRDAFAGSLYRAREDELAAGHVVRLRGMEVQVLGARDGNPYRLRVRFDLPLDDRRLLFLHARPSGLRRFKPPGIGERLLLPRAATPWRTK